MRTCKCTEIHSTCCHLEQLLNFQSPFNSQYDTKIRITSKTESFHTVRCCVQVDTLHSSGVISDISKSTNSMHFLTPDCNMDDRFLLPIIQYSKYSTSYGTLWSELELFNSRQNFNMQGKPRNERWNRVRGTGDMTARSFRWSIILFRRVAGSGWEKR